MIDLERVGRGSYPHCGQLVWMTYSGVFPLVNGQVAGRLPSGNQWSRRVYFQRVDSTKPTMISPKPIPMFHAPMAPIGYSVWVM